MIWWKDTVFITSSIDFLIYMLLSNILFHNWRWSFYYHLLLFYSHYLIVIFYVFKCYLKKRLEIHFCHARIAWKRVRTSVERVSARQRYTGEAQSGDSDVFVFCEAPEKTHLIFYENCFKMLGANRLQKCKELWDVK